MIHLNFFDIKKRILGIIYYILSFVCDNAKFFFLPGIPFPLSFEDQNNSCILKKHKSKKKKKKKFKYIYNF